jgi:hypothetical protein
MMNSTGAGDIDPPEKMEPGKLAWLEKECPFYGKIDDILCR